MCTAGTSGEKAWYHCTVSQCACVIYLYVLLTGSGSLNMDLNPRIITDVCDSEPRGIWAYVLLNLVTFVFCLAVLLVAGGVVMSCRNYLHTS